MQCYVKKPILIGGNIINAGRTVELALDQYVNLRRDDNVETVGEHEARTKADAIIAKARAEAEASALEYERAARAVAKDEADKARAEAEASAPKRDKRAALSAA